MDNLWIIYGNTSLRNHGGWRELEPQNDADYQSPDPIYLPKGHDWGEYYTNTIPLLYHCNAITIPLLYHYYTITVHTITIHTIHTITIHTITLPLLYPTIPLMWNALFRTRRWTSKTRPLTLWLMQTPGARLDEGGGRLLMQQIWLMVSDESPPVSSNMAAHGVLVDACHTRFFFLDIFLLKPPIHRVFSIAMFDYHCVIKQRLGTKCPKMKLHCFTYLAPPCRPSFRG